MPESPDSSTVRLLSPSTPRPCDLVEAGFLFVFAVFATVGWVAITLAELHLFRAGVFGGLAALSSAAAVWLLWRDWAGVRASVVRMRPIESVLLAALLGGSAVIFFQPAEFLFGGSDASVYSAIAAAIEEHGGITFSDPLLEVIPENARAALFPRDPRWPQLYNRFAGGVQMAEGEPQILPNFFHLYPVLGACLTLVFGTGAPLYVNPASAVLSVWALWLLGRRLSSPAAGWIAATLLAVNFGQLWFARVSFSEMLSQYLMLSGFLFTAMAVDGGPRSTGVCAGAAFGLAAFCRIDLLCIVSPLILAFLAITTVAYRFPSLPWYAMSFLLITTHAVVHALVVTAPYTLRLLAKALTTLLVLGPLVAVPFVILVALVMAVWRFGLPRQPRARQTTRYLLGALAVVSVIGLAPPVMTGYVWKLISPVGVVFAVIGFGLLMWRDGSLSVLPLAAIFVVFTILYNDPARSGFAMPEVFRRLVPVVLPLALLFAAHGVFRVGTLRPRITRLAYAVPVILAGLFAARSWPVIANPPMRDVRAQVERFVTRFPPGSLLLFDRSVPSHLGLSVNYAFDREVLVVHPRDGMPEALGTLLDQAFARGRPVFAVTMGLTADAGTSLRRHDLERFRVRPVGMDTLRFAVLVPTRTEFPKQVTTLERTLETYRILPRSRPPSYVPLPVTIDVGALDFDTVLRGFHDRERMPSATARWTQHEAEVVLPPIMDDADQRAELIVRMSAWRPVGVPAPRSVFSIGSRMVGTIAAVTPGFSEYRFPLDPDTMIALRSGTDVLRIVSDSFVPQAAGVGDDNRALGVALDWIGIKRADTRSDLLREPVRNEK